MGFWKVKKEGCLEWTERIDKTRSVRLLLLLIWFLPVESRKKLFFISAEKIKLSMSRANSNEETYNQGQDVNDSLRQGRRRSNSLVTELIYSDQEGSNPDVTLSTASPLTRVQLLRMGSYGDILGELICCSFPILTYQKIISSTKIIKKEIRISCTIKVITNTWHKSSSIKLLPGKWTSRRTLWC